MKIRPQLYVDIGSWDWTRPETILLRSFEIMGWMRWLTNVKAFIVYRDHECGCKCESEREVIHTIKIIFNAPAKQSEL